MFYDRFKQLCDRKGVSVSRACIEMGLSRSIAAKWKNTRTNPSAEVLPKIAAYFGVTADYLLTGMENAPAETGGRDIGFDDFTYAMQEEARDLTDEDKQLLLSMARQLGAARKAPRD